MAFDFTGFVREQGSLEALQSVGFAELATEFKAVDLRVVENKDGKRFLHLINAAGQYLSTAIGGKVTLVATAGADMIKELVNNYILFYGVSEAGNHWMTWAPQPTSNEPVVVAKVADILKGFKPQTAKA